MEQLQYVLLAFPILLLSLTVHEFGHAWVALKQGDDTAYRQGRVSLNPAVHIDPIGTLAFPIIAMLTGAPLLGWAKPVPVNSAKYRNYRRGDVLVSVAGVVMNALLALAFAAIVAAIVAATGAVRGPQALGILTEMMIIGVYANVGLIFFNLLPIPPLDGSHVFYHMLPPEMGLRYRQIYPYGMLILWGLVLTNALSWLFTGPVRAVAGLLLTPAAFFLR